MWRASSSVLRCAPPPQDIADGKAKLPKIEVESDDEEKPDLEIQVGHGDEGGRGGGRWVLVW